MPISLRALAQDRHTLHIDYGEEGDLNIVFTPSLITEKLIRQIRSIHSVETADEIDEMAAALNMTLLRVIESWDVTDEAGAVIPLTEDGLADLPLMTRVGLLNKVIDEMRLGETNGTPSKPRSRKR